MEKTIYSLTMSHLIIWLIFYNSLPISKFLLGRSPYQQVSDLALGFKLFAICLYETKPQIGVIAIAFLF